MDAVVRISLRDVHGDPADVFAQLIPDFFGAVTPAVLLDRLPAVICKGRQVVVP